MEYITASEAAEMWGITKRRVNILCSQGRIAGAEKKGNIWLLPADCQKPADARIKPDKNGLYDKIKW